MKQFVVKVSWEMSCGDCECLQHGRFSRIHLYTCAPNYIFLKALMDNSYLEHRQG